MKQCTQCKEHKETAQFTADKRNKDGLQNVCKTCRAENVKKARLANPERFKQYDKNRYESRKNWRKQYVKDNREKINENKRIWAANNRDKVQANDRKRKYGVTKEEYTQALKLQENKCKICKSELQFDKPRAVHTDHCHTTGKFRGILCRNCNNGLGHFRESVEIIEAAIAYIKTNV